MEDRCCVCGEPIPEGRMVCKACEQKFAPSVIPSETQEQIAVADYCRLWKIRVVHIPNEGKRSLTGRVEQKRLGLAKGFPDLFFPYPRKGSCGLFIEMKRERGRGIYPRPSKEQEEWLSWLTEQGYESHVCYGFDEAREVIDKYFNLGTKKGER